MLLSFVVAMIVDIVGFVAFVVFVVVKAQILPML